MTNNDGGDSAYGDLSRSLGAGFLSGAATYFGLQPQSTQAVATPVVANQQVPSDRLFTQYVTTPSAANAIASNNTLKYVGIAAVGAVLILGVFLIARRK